MLTEGRGSLVLSNVAAVSGLLEGRPLIGHAFHLVSHVIDALLELFEVLRGFVRRPLCALTAFVGDSLGSCFILFVSNVCYRIIYFLALVELLDILVVYYLGLLARVSHPAIRASLLQ